MPSRSQPSAVDLPLLTMARLPRTLDPSLFPEEQEVGAFLKKDGPIEV